MFDNPVMLHGNDVQIERVREIDPLGADAVLARLPEMNDAADLGALVGALRDLVPDAATTAAFDMEDCLAAVRDIGMLLGSIKRHGQEPLDHVPEATPVLLELGERTGMIPRDVVHHYCTWNPTDHRRRRYTPDEQEHQLQNSVRMVFPHLRAGLELCHLLRDVEPADPKFAVLADALNREMLPMVDSIDLVVRDVGPRFFARVLRPYFEEITVAGRVYLGPAAAQVPLWLVDEAVWASDRGDRDYLDFLHHSVPYSLPRWRGLHDDWVGSTSLVTRLLDAYGDDLEAADRAMPTLRAAASAMAGVLRTIIVFRGRHLGIARQAYQEDLRLYPLGSGGASVELLREIVDLTRQNAQMTKTLASSGAARVVAKA
ncbi:monodechloroaminopyrrolnitrin synthase PrnB family protein [Saccharothrix sp. Mg75]|uniref:monodechloroaminopyrrolnitrin synthase PrnB family protein n=1 Tax=Saccharothrix sp. Mg75 TaxID=3445357 RepID=UPI003EEB6178